MRRMQALWTENIECPLQIVWLWKWAEVILNLLLSKVPSRMRTVVVRYGNAHYSFPCHPLTTHMKGAASLKNCLVWHSSWTFRKNRLVWHSTWTFRKKSERQRKYNASFEMMCVWLWQHPLLVNILTKAIYSATSLCTYFHIFHALSVVYTSARHFSFQKRRMAHFTQRFP